MDAIFPPSGRGGHQIMIEEGYTWPGTVTVASDSHANSYGAMASIFTNSTVRRREHLGHGPDMVAAAPYRQGHLIGVLPPGVTGKDVIIALCGLFNQDDVLNHSIEFNGSEQTMRSISVDERITIANMTTEWGALSG
jgi:homoaconitate hydratase